MNPQSLATRDEGPAVEREIAFDMVRRSLPFVPILLLASGLIWGVDGALSSGYAIVLVLANFVLAASIMAAAARISFTLLMVAALGGYLFRLALITAAVFAVHGQDWVKAVPLGMTIIVTHLGLLLWETRYISASLAFPGLKPRKG